MIRVRYIPQVGLPSCHLSYSWEGLTLTATLYRNEEVVGQEVYDLSALQQPGDEMVNVNPRALPFSPLITAKRIDGETLEVGLLYWHEPDDEPELGEEEIVDG
jgi:hypothetical protein